MSSDSNSKSSHQTSQYRAAFTRYLLYAISIFLCTYIYNSLVVERQYQYQSSSTTTSDPEKTYLKRIEDGLPKKCHPKLHSFLQNQNLPNENEKKIIVFGCHRKWCNKPYGHCEQTSGLGDRTRHLLSLITDAMTKGLPVQLDYPQEGNGISLRLEGYSQYSNSNNNIVDIEYKDPWGFVADTLLRFRSYDVSDKMVLLDEWDVPPISPSDNQEFVNILPTKPRYHLHHDYDPCLYHILFKPTDLLQMEINYYSNLFGLDLGDVIGIHFRTGDLAAFGVQNRDVRADGLSLKEGYDRMLKCGEDLAGRLNISPNRLHFFLATDNEQVKTMAKLERHFVVHVTPDKPSAYLRAEGDLTAYLELYLLSKTKGLTMNRLSKDYDGPAEKISTFAMLAKNIGFMDDSRILPCDMDVQS